MKQTLPDYILTATEQVQQMYMELLLAEKEVDEHKNRFVLVDENLIDLKPTSYLLKLKEIQATPYQIELIKRLRVKYLEPYILKYKVAKKKWDTYLKKNTDKEQRINELTPLILDYAGRCYGIEDIITIFKEEKSIALTENELKRFFLDNRELIENRKNKFLNSSKDFRIATDSGRLEILNGILIDYQMRYRDANTSENQRIRYGTLIQSVIEQARKEVKGNELKLTVEGKIDIEATMHGEENVFNAMKYLNINSLVLGLTAAKVGLQPETLISQLNQSMYAKYNGFSNNVLGSEDVVLPSQLQKAFDWDDLRKKNRVVVDQMITPHVEVVDTEAVEIKDKLLDRLKNFKQ